MPLDGAAAPTGSPIDHPSLLSHRPAVPMKRSSSSSGPSAHVVSSACGVLVILRWMLSSVLRLRRVKILFRKGSET
jgi:hypothetical protein